MKKDIILFFIILIFVVGCASAAAYFYKLYYMPNETVVAISGDADTLLVIEGDLILDEHPPVVADGQVLLPFDTVKAHIDSYIWWDGTLKKVTVTTKDKVIRMETEVLNAYINQEPIDLKFPATEIEGVLYLPIDFLAQFYKIRIQYAESTNIVMIDREETIRRVGYPISTEAVVRQGRHVRYPIVKQFSEQNLQDDSSKMYVYEEYDEWYKVRTAEGIIGYIQKKDVVIKAYELGTIPEKIKKKPVLPSGKINLVWDQMYSPTKSYLERAKKEGIDVLSPTWFQVANENGDLINRTDPQYIEWAHENGYQVWALVANDFKNIEGTSRILNDEQKREHIIKQMLAFAALYQLDGINVDFENMYKSDKEAFTQFMREFAPMARQQNLIISVDVTIPDGSDTWSKCYDRKALGETVDYVCLMTYDQTSAGSTVAGSTAQLDWVEENLKKTLREVPAEKLLMGIPLYTRLWTEYVDERGKVKAETGKALSMEAAYKLIEENGAQPVWDEKSGQYVVSFEKDKVTYKMWLEDEHSVNYKSILAHKYNLAGTSVWSHNFANEKVWDVFVENLKNIAHFEEWKSKNFAAK